MTNDELQAHIKAIEGAISAGLVEERADFDGPNRPAGMWASLQGRTMVIGNPRLKMRIRPREIYVIYDSAGNMQNFSRSKVCAEQGAAYTENVVTFREVIE